MAKDMLGLYASLLAMDDDERKKALETLSGNGSFDSFKNTKLNVDTKLFEAGASFLAQKEGRTSEDTYNLIYNSLKNASEKKSLASSWSAAQAIKSGSAFYDEKDEDLLAAINDLGYERYFLNIGSKGGLSKPDLEDTYGTDLYRRVQQNAETKKAERKATAASQQKTTLDALVDKGLAAWFSGGSQNRTVDKITKGITYTLPTYKDILGEESEADFADFKDSIKGKDTLKTYVEKRIGGEKNKLSFANYVEESRYPYAQAGAEAIGPLASDETGTGAEGVSLRAGQQFRTPEQEALYEKVSKMMPAVQEPSETGRGVGRRGQRGKKTEEVQEEPPATEQVKLTGQTLDRWKWAVGEKADQNLADMLNLFEETGLSEYAQDYERKPNRYSASPLSTNTQFKETVARLEAQGMGRSEAVEAATKTPDAARWVLLNKWLVSMGVEPISRDAASYDLENGDIGTIDLSQVVRDSRTWMKKNRIEEYGGFQKFLDSVGTALGQGISGVLATPGMELQALASRALNPDASEEELYQQDATYRSAVSALEGMQSTRAAQNETYGWLTNMLIDTGSEVTRMAGTAVLSGGMSTLAEGAGMASQMGLKAVASVPFVTSAFASGSYEALRDGATPGQAAAMGVINAASEGLTDYAISTIPFSKISSQLGGLQTGAGKAAIEAGKRTLMQAYGPQLMALLETAGAEGLQEGMQSVIEDVASFLVYGRDLGRELDVDLKKAGKNALMGALIGGVYAGVSMPVASESHKQAVAAVEKMVQGYQLEAQEIEGLFAALEMELGQIPLTSEDIGAKLYAAREYAESGGQISTARIQQAGDMALLAARKFEQLDAQSSALQQELARLNSESDPRDPDATNRRIDLTKRLHDLHTEMRDASARLTQTQGQLSEAQAAWESDMKADYDARTPEYRRTTSPEQVVKVPVSEIHTDPAAYQYKSGVDARGVTGLFSDVETYDPLLGGVLLLHERLDGTLYAADGHHRAELAQRTGAQEVDARILREADGVTVEDARRIAALSNIASGRGSATDAAKVIRNSGMNADALAKSGISMREPVARSGATIAGLTDEIFGAVVDGRLSEGKAAMIGEAFAGDAARQEAFWSDYNNLTERGRDMSNEVFREYLDMYRSARVDESTQTTLFGDESIFTSNAVDLARVSAAVKQRLNQEKRLFSQLSDAARAELAERAGNILSQEGNVAALEGAQALGGVFDALKYTKGPVNAMLTEASSQVTDGILNVRQASAAVTRGMKTILERDGVRGLWGETSTIPQTGGEIRQNVDVSVAPQTRAEYEVESVEGLAAPDGSYATPNQTISQSVQTAPFNTSDPRWTGGDVPYAVVEPGGEIRSAQQITNDLARDLGLTKVNTSRFRKAGVGKNARAYYVVHPEALVSRSAQDVQPVLHEVGHHMYDKYNMADSPALAEAQKRLSAAFADQYAEAQLPGEAFAEFYKTYVVNPDLAKQMAPALYDDFSGKLSSGDAKIMRKYSGQILALMNAEVDARMRSTIRSYDEVQRAKRVQERGRAYEKVISQGFDNLYALEKYDAAAIKFGERTAQEAGVVTAAMNYRMAGGTSEYIVNSGLVDRQGNPMGDSFTSLVDGLSKAEYGDLTNYLKANHALTLNNLGIQVLPDAYLSTSDAQAIVDKASPEIISRAQGIYQWWDRFMQEWYVDSGLMSQTAWDELREKYPTYVPMKRVMDGGAGLRGSGKDVSNPDATLKSIKGSQRDTYDPIESMMGMIAQGVAVNRQMDTLRMIAGTYDAVPGLASAGYLREVSRDVVMQEYDVTPQKERFRAELESMGAANPDDIMAALDGAIADQLKNVFMEKTGSIKGENGVMSVVMEDGKIRWFEVLDPGTVEALAQFNGPEMHDFMKMVMKWTNATGSMITGRNPFFLLTNVPRDFFTGFLRGSTNNPAKYLADYIMAYKDIATNAETYQLYKALGGSAEWSAMPSAKQLHDSVQEALSDAATLGTRIEKAFDVTLEGLNKVTEAAPRYAEFKRMYEKTGDRRLALESSMESTMNFWRKGKVTSVARGVTMFFNPLFQGTYEIIRAVEQPSQRHRVAPLLIRSAVLGAAASALAEWLCRDYDDEAYDMMADRIKETHIILPNYASGADGKNPFIRIALPQGPYFALFGGAGKRIAGEALALIEGRDYDEDWDAMLENFVGNLPHNISWTFSSFTDAARNETWYGGSIVPTALLDRSPRYQYDENTSEIGKLIGDILNVSPKQVDYVIKQNTGGLGDVLLPLATKGQGIKTVIENVVRRATVNPVYSNDIADTFYRDSDFINSVLADAEDMNAYTQLRGDLTDDEAQAAVAEAAELRKGFTSDRKVLKETWNMIDEVQQDAGLPDDEKHQEEIRLRRIILEVQMNRSVDVARFRDLYVRRRPQ